MKLSARQPFVDRPDKLTTWHRGHLLPESLARDAASTQQRLNYAWQAPGANLSRMREVEEAAQAAAADAARIDVELRATLRYEVAGAGPTKIEYTLRWRDASTGASKSVNVGVVDNFMR